MSKKFLVLSIVIGLLVVGASVFALNNNQKDNTDREVVATDITTENNKTTDNSSTVPEEAIGNDGSYITLAEYDSDSAKYNDTKVVYFFHASWCPICRSIDEDLLADMPQIPEGVTIVKTDFDNSTDLRKKYGVTNQYTFVQVDNNGNETSQWSATSSTDAIAGIKS
jgi:thiol-disulfide isomerase/thioredoxin